MRAKTFAHRFIQSNQGVAMIEFAFILPVLVLITFGATEYGMYFLKSNMNNNNVAAAARAVQADPGDPSNRELLTQTSLINDEDNKLCANSFASLEAAKTADCPAGLWNTLPPKDLPEGQTAYFVLIESNVASKSLSGLFDEGSALEVVMPTNVARQVIKVSENNAQNAHTCNGAPLLGKVCIGINETACADGADRNGNHSDCHYTSSIVGVPVCSASGWTCDIYQTSQDFKFVENEVSLFDRCNPPKQLGKLEKWNNLKQAHPFVTNDLKFERAPSWCN